MKKAISLLLILATLLSCCVWFFACKPKPDDDLTVDESGALKDNSTVVLNLEDSGVASSAGLTPSDKTYDLSGATASAQWNVASQKILTLNFEKKGLADYKEVSFWMLNDSNVSIDKFAVYFVMEDGTEIRTKSILYFQHNNKPGDNNIPVQNITIHPGWNHYKFPLSEAEPMWDKSYSYVEGTDSDEEGSIALKFDTSKIVGIKLAAHNSTTLGSQKLYITSIKASNVKSGTISGYAIDNIANAVCFYEDSNAYLYNQNRYLLHADEKVGVQGDKTTAMVPVEVLARHRGAEITANDKEAKLISFNYNGKSYTFKDGDEISFVGDERGFSAGKDLKVNASTVGEYVTIPMEKAAEIFGYNLFYDQMGLIVFSDKNLKDYYLHPLHENYRTDRDHGMPGVYLIVQVIIFKNYTGADIINDMNAIHGEEGHTKLMVTQEMFDALKERLETDQVYAAWFNRFEAANAKGTASYNSALPQYELSDGYRLLNMSRNVMATLLTYSFLYKMTDNEDYALKVKKTMTALTRFVDDELTNAGSWHPEHTLDTGEIMYGYGIAYDWCYDYLAKDKKALATIEEGVWELGYGAMMGFGDLYEWWDNPDNLKKYDEEMENDGDPSTTTWQKYTLGNLYNIDTGTKYSKYNFTRYMWTNNWGAVCNGGTAVMALAFANVNTEFRAASEYLLDCVMFNFPCTLYEGYGPDGGYPEGPGYWSYGTQYSILLISSIATATGSDMGFTFAPGFRESFYFINGASSVALGTWNYHDAGVGGIDGSRFFWFAHYCGDKNIAAVRYNQLNNGKSNPGYWDLMFYNPNLIADTVALDLDYCYYGIGVTTFHSDWTDSALFCGLHGGANAASHGQLDIGNFIVEYGGTRFFFDLGSDEYNLTGYKDGEVTYFTTPYRYWYYRNKAEGQNTLVINPVKVDISKNDTDKKKPANKGLSWDQHQGTNYDSLYGAESDVLRFESGKNSALSVIDMACAYRDALAIYYACPSCDYENSGICTNSRCAATGTQLVLTYDDKNDKYVLKCPTPSCNLKKDAVCPDCGETLIEKRNGIRGMLVTENRTTVVIQDEMYLKTPATKILWMGHVAEGSKVTISEDMQSALIQLDGKTLLVQMVFPEGYDIKWRFETQAADYLPETGLVMTPGEYDRDGMQKLVAIAETEEDGQQVTEIKLAVVCKLLSAGPHNYTWTDIEDWTIN